jgi:hypothetical protein
MTYRRTRREIAFANSMVSRLESPSKVFELVQYWHPVGPWHVAIFTPAERKLVCRRYFNANEVAPLQQWLFELGSQFKYIQWFVMSGKGTKRP